ncbi:Lrp/AsnC family transcriptional regulator [Clostridium tyrobutyricum]|uniref:siroheme decarboxylase subunit beta n=1 Tax=Clostridium tyrobutyricum TaxID=1519 RepID=UPI001C391924|nr:Lrp/AsnC family transcriptional regulator [Clostridium tyrobutyricum]MBV4419527.1 Lrp/AsnC family transcriptional regulator [Clostridium tyrobutyricum]
MLDKLDKKIICRLQNSIPVNSRPYKDIADDLGIGEDELLDRIRYYNKVGILKRIGAVLYHRRAGFKANAMVVWNVDKKDMDTIGGYMASIPEISHCCSRKKFGEWKYELYTMVHAKSREKCSTIIKNIANNTEIEDYRVLYSIRELKKTSVKYF